MKSLPNFSRALSVATLSILCAGAAKADNVIGKWDRVTILPYVPINHSTLPNGKVLMWPGDRGLSGDDPRLYDPVTHNLTTVNKAGYDLFCTGHSFLPNGNLFVAGGHIENGVGLPKASIFNSTTNTWSVAPDMNAGRWYPTVTTLPNGDALVVSGDIDLNVGTNPLPQVYQSATNSWRNLTNAQLAMDYYPFMFVAPNGKVINVGPTPVTRYLDTAGTGAWSFVANRLFGDRNYGSAVMFDTGKILVMGGGLPPTNHAEMIDLNKPDPQWRQVQRMKIARRQLNATILADGTVLATGGSSGDGFNNEDAWVAAAELWSPETEQWTTMASSTVPRIYHSSTLLLHDGRVLSTGGNNYPETEIYSPPYLFKGARPVISSAPDRIGYGQRFSIATPESSGISKITLIRLSSATHGFNSNQRMNKLPFYRETGSVNVAAPANANLAPPGHYLLFILNANGVPSVGKVVILG